MQSITRIGPKPKPRDLRAAAPIAIERVAEYWQGRLKTRKALSDHGDHEAEDAKVAQDYAEIIAGLGGATPVEDIPAYRAVSERKMSYAGIPKAS